jgi:hypothetical protein
VASGSDNLLSGSQKRGSIVQSHRIFLICVACLIWPSAARGADRVDPDIEPQKHSAAKTKPDQKSDSLHSNNMEPVSKSSRNRPDKVMMETARTAVRSESKNGASKILKSPLKHGSSKILKSQSKHGSATKTVNGYLSIADECYQKCDYKRALRYYRDAREDDPAVANAASDGILKCMEKLRAGGGEQP